MGDELIKANSENKGHLSLFSIAIAILGIIPILIFAFIKDTGNDLYKYVFGINIVFTIPHFNELCFYIGTILLCSAFTLMFAERTCRNLLIVTQAMVIFSMYLGDCLMLLPINDSYIKLIVIIILVSINFLCVLTIYRITRNIKISFIPGLAGFLAVLLNIIGIQVNMVILHGFNSGMGVENIPLAILGEFVLNSAPAILVTITIYTVSPYFDWSKL